MTEEEYLRTIMPAIKIVVRKSQDYNSNVQVSEYFPFGELSYIHMLNLKVTRLRNLAQNDTQDQKVNFESMYDTALDLINYAVYYLKYLQEQNDERVGTKLYDPFIRGSEHG